MSNEKATCRSLQQRGPSTSLGDEQATVIGIEAMTINFQPAASFSDFDHR
jgi:hypothetical protein